MAGNEKEAYSQLEALPQHRKERPLPMDLGKQVVPDDGKQRALEKVPPTYLGKQVVPDDGKQRAVDRVGMEVDPNGNFNSQCVGDQKIPIHRSSRMKWMLFVGVVSLVIIAAAVLGGVFGSRHKNHGTAIGAPSTNHSNSSIVSSSGTPTQRNIAALSYSVNAVNNTRLCFQDDAGQFIEAANSADHPEWVINKSGIVGKNGSAMAVAVSRPGFPLTIILIYLDVNNLIHDACFSPSTSKWTSGTLSDHGYTAMANSSLAAMYHQCRLCPNTTIIAFQDRNGFVQIGNLTSHGWALTQLGPALEPAMGTGLALQPFYRNGMADQINLYHQKSSLNMGLTSWVTELLDVGGWDLNHQNYSTIPAGSPIAAASSYPNVSSGVETWIEVLSISHNGVQVDTWSGAINDWLEQYNVPSVMANSTSDQKVYGAVAVTAIGSAFGVVKQTGQADTIENWQVADDMRDWTLVGNVDLGGIWG